MRGLPRPAKCTGVTPLTLTNNLTVYPHPTKPCSLLLKHTVTSRISHVELCYDSSQVQPQALQYRPLH